ncbi:MAG: endolytic transglycosylase MltG [Actinobacteria bacterium]|nr:MAG: endolytic transglycosylase MltG [Actinomycetota bacterium]
MALFRRQERLSQRTPEQRAHARAVRDARRRGLPEPPPPAVAERREPAGAEELAATREPDWDEPAAANEVDREPAAPVEPAPSPPSPEPPPSAGPPPPALPPDLAAAREPEPPPYAAPPPSLRVAPPDVEPLAARIPHDEAAAASARGRGRSWAATDEWVAADPEPPQGDPLAPGAAPERVPHEDPEPADPPRPHGDPLVPHEEDAPPPAATAAVAGAPSANGRGRSSDPARPRLGLRARRAAEESPGRVLGRDLPPLPPRTAARQPPAPPRRPRNGPPAPPARGPEPRHRRRWLLRFFALVALGAAAVAIAFLVELFQPFKGPGHGEVRLTIPNGTTARQIGNLLEARGVVDDGRLFALRAALAGKRGDFKSGAFALKRDMSYADAIAVLTTNPGAAPTVSVTIPEGRSRRETAPLLRQAGIRGDYLTATGRRPPADLGAPRGTTSLEGFLFPATYELPERKATAQELVDEQLTAFRANFAKVNMGRARRANLSRFDVLTIASMVEREAQVPRDRRLIAAVIYNRLKDGIPLSIDATIRYATGNWSSPLRQSELNRDSPYNLRKHTGLPPTPIGNPGLASIQAAAHPARVPYLYYVLKPCAHGAHAFSATDAQFQRDVRAYNAMRTKLGGRSPVDC